MFYWLLTVFKSNLNLNVYLPTFLTRYLQFIILLYRIVRILSTHWVYKIFNKVDKSENKFHSMLRNLGQLPIKKNTLLYNIWHQSKKRQYILPGEHEDHLFGRIMH